MEIIFNGIHKLKTNDSLGIFFSDKYLEIKNEPSYGILEEINVYSDDTVYNFILGELENLDLEILNIEQRIDTALKIVGLNEEIKTNSINEISKSELKKVQLAIVFVQNPKTIIIQNFSKGLIKSEKKNLIMLLRNINQKHNKNLIVIDDKIDFLLQFKDIFYVFENELVLKNKDDFLKKKNIDKPAIFKFIDKMHAKGIKIPYYVDTKDLLKAIYREVKK